MLILKGLKGLKVFGGSARGLLCGKMSSSSSSIRVLNVAEKNDAAKNIADLLSGGACRRSEGLSKFNKIYSFESMVEGRKCEMRMTSVSGHLLGYEFPKEYRKWYSCSPIRLFDVPLEKTCKEEMENIKKTLEREARGAAWLIIWTDGDREGENIGFEIKQVCQAVRPNLRVFRAKFSEITRVSVSRALQSLCDPDERLSSAVDVRQQLDLRIGAAFTRFQTLRLAKKFPSLSEQLISYGSCQFPTMGFVVERYKAIEKFVPEAFWKLKVTHSVENIKVEFSWKRIRLFDIQSARVYHDICLENPVAKVEDCKSKHKSKWRPLPLDTVELEKLGSRKLRINAKVTMQTAEKLYTSGYISYPRTETNIFPKEMDLIPLVKMQTQSSQWGEFARGILQEQDKGPDPRKGKKSDQAHPPIHPIKFASNLQGNEAKLYEFIVRHFLAVVSKDAIGKETTVNIDINGEKFIGHGLTIIERNFLEVYPYERWSDKEILNYEVIKEFEPSTIELVDGSTAPPNLLTEADLIALMDKHGIGTDATHAEHIETIKNRNYVGIQDKDKFVPGQLGIALCDGYDAMGFEMSKPHLRSSLEADLKLISEGVKDSQIVLQEQIANYKRVFEIAVEKVNKIDESCMKYLNEAPRENLDSIGSSYSSSSESRFTPTISDTVKCSCGHFAAEKPVMKEGPNKGRKFYTCPTPMNEESRCDFFQWVDNSQPSSGGRTSSIDGSSITCNCGKIANNRIVQKEGPNKGRAFWSCSLNLGEEGRCNFFKWAEEVLSTSTQASVLRNSVDENSVTCNCGSLAVKKTVSKEGPNKGREFLVCSKPFTATDKCQFFQWTDELSSSSHSRGPFNRLDSNFGSSSNPTSGRSKLMKSGQKRPGSDSRTDSTEKKKRKCGLCQEEGHTRNKCPLKHN